MAGVRPLAPHARERLAVLLLLGVALLVLCHRALDPSLQLYDRDTGRIDYPFKWYVASRLKAFELPLWIPWTEAGTSLLGHAATALFHPFTLLYLALPFELAFKLNHLLALPLATLGAWLLARELGASRWGAAAGAISYAASGWLVSMVASSVPHALSAAAGPFALWALLRLWKRPSPLRLLGASAALALTALGGDVQWLFFCALAAVAGVLLASARDRGAALRLSGLTASWILCALLLGGPALFPPLARAARIGRSQQARSIEAKLFSIRAARLPGVALPWAFDDRLERSSAPDEGSAFEQYFSGPARRAFGASIVIGVPALLLAAFAGRGRAALLFSAAAICALAALGDAFPPDRWLSGTLPGYPVFRNAERWIAPLLLALSLGAALGATRAAGDPRSSTRLARVALGVAAILVGGGALLLSWREPVLDWLIARSAGPVEQPAHELLQVLQASLLVEGGFAAALGLVALARAPWTPASIALVCAGAAYAASAGLLFVAPTEMVHGRFELAEELLARGGPSANRWRIDSDPTAPYAYPGFDRRLGTALYYRQGLATQWNGVAGVESVAVHGGLIDGDYTRAWRASPASMTALFGVRFQVRTPAALTLAEAKRLGFRQAPNGFWFREQPLRPRAFLVDCAEAAADPERALSAPGFRPWEMALVDDPALTSGLACEGSPGSADFARPRSERMEIRSYAARPALLVVAEHFDPGWTAAVDGRSAPVFRVDMAAMGIRVPAGDHSVVLRFWPAGLTPGLLCCSGMVVALCLAELALRRRKTGGISASSAVDPK